jgi:hypothetical protein
MLDIESLLSNGDLRSIASVEELLPQIGIQEDFDTLFAYLFSDNRLLVMRAADAVEKLTRRQSQYLVGHEAEILQLLETARDIELKWHLALLMPRLTLSPDDLAHVWQVLAGWAVSENESRIVRVNSLQALYEFSVQNPEKQEELDVIFNKVQQEGVPSINARIKRLKM